MGKFSVIPENTFSEIQTDAGVLLKTFDPATGAEPNDEDIICATTGGITATCVPTYTDYGEDVDNCPGNMMELKHLSGWDCKLAFVSLGTSADAVRLALGAADINTATGAVTPRATLKAADYSDIWWVGDRADGGMLAVQLKNALSTGGFSLKSVKNGKGQITMELTGHVSLEAQEVVPMVFYSKAASTQEGA